ncbi:MAG: RimK/LysX family protein [Nanoarchaeota archaeon]|nr:RimK/LysX family protein [Nanoarchaeota archaeon]
MIKERTIIGCREPVFLKLGNKKRGFIARIDTGAKTSSLDMQLAVELSHSKILKTKVIKSANGIGLRPVIKVEIILAGKKITSNFTLADRSRMKYKILIGRNILRKEKFLIDPLKKLHKEFKY